MPYISYLYSDKLSNSIKAGRQMIGAFDPDKLIGSVGSWRADRGIYLSDSITRPNDSDSVYRWNDYSGLSDDLFNVVSSKQPILHENSLNGQPIVSFTKESSQYLIANNPLNFNIVTPTIFMVGKWNSGAAFCGKGDGNVTDGRHRKLMIEPFGAGNLFCYWAGTDAMSGNTIYADTTQWGIYIIRAYRDNLTNFNFNGVETIRTTPTISNSYLNTASFTLGCGFQHGAEFGSVDIAEFRLFNRLLRPWEVLGLVNYASTRYGISITSAPYPELIERSVANHRVII